MDSPPLLICSKSEVSEDSMAKRCSDCAKEVVSNILANSYGIEIKYEQR